jgi:Fe-S-cluster containining protein
MNDRTDSGSDHPGVVAAKANLREFNRRLSRSRFEKEEKILARRIESYVDSDPHRALREMYDYFDRYYAIASDLTACRDKCSFCCMIPASIGADEASILSGRSGIPIKPTKRYRLEPTFLVSPCPFLKEGSCSVYADRPMVCRTHHNYSNTNNACLPSSTEPEMQLDRWSTFPNLMRVYNRIRANGIESGDIRSFF